MNKKITRFLKQIIIALVAAIILWTMISMMFEDNFVFFPTKYPEGRYEDSVYIQNIKDCWIKTEDGIKIHGWYSSNNNAIATLVIAHGNAGNISHRIDIFRTLHRNGYNVLMFDYRGYGRSEGTPCEEGIYKDGRAAFDYVKAIQPTESLPIIFWGTSLGGAVVVDVALHRQVAGLILESTFTSAKDFAAIHYPFLPVRYFMKNKMNSIDKIKSINVPILIIHGSNDAIVPIHLGKELFEAANEPKEFYEVVSADHNDTYLVGGTAYLQKINNFIMAKVIKK